MLLLRYVRTARGLRLKDVAARTGMSLIDISRVEREQARPWPGWRRRLAAALDVAEELLFRPAVEAKP